MEMPARKPENRAYGLESVADIEGQLEVTEEWYQKILKDFENGALSEEDGEYLEEMRKNLADFKNILFKMGIKTPEDLEISNRITERLAKLPKPATQSA